MQRVGMVGRDLEDAAVDVRRSRPLLVLLQQDRDRERFVQAEGAVVVGELLHMSTAQARLVRLPSLFALMSYLK